MIAGRAALASVVVLCLATATLTAGAQPAGPVRTIGIIGHSNAVSFVDGLRGLGWVEGKNVRFDSRKLWTRWPRSAPTPSS